MWAASLLASLPAAVFGVIGHVRAAAADGALTADEGESIARALSAESGDVLRVHVRGVDVIGPDAQADLFAFVGRVTVRAVRAARG